MQSLSAESYRSFHEVPVITEELILSCVEQFKDGGDEKNLAHALRIRMSFRGIVDLINFEMFTRLEFLCLSNNKIDCISTLPCLSALQLLDLSFNFVSSLNAVDESRFPALRDLCLYSNNIESLKCFPVFEKLEVLSLGRNLIRDFDEIYFLQQLPSIMALNLQQNPVRFEESIPTIHLVLPKLRFFNYTRLSVCVLFLEIYFKPLSNERQRYPSLIHPLTHWLRDPLKRLFGFWVDLGPLRQKYQEAQKKGKKRDALRNSLDGCGTN